MDPKSEPVVRKGKPVERNGVPLRIPWREIIKEKEYMQKITKIILILAFLGVIALWQPQTIFLHQNYDPMLWIAFLISLIICIFGIVWEIKEIREEKGSPPFFINLLILYPFRFCKQTHPICLDSRHRS